MKVIKLIPDNNTRFHFGDMKGNINKLFSSEQLFSAIINKAALMYPEKVESIIELFLKDKIKISSLFYGLDFISCEKNIVEKSINFYPRPQAKIKNKKESYTKEKLIKKITYLSLDALKEVLNNWNAQQQTFAIDIDDFVFIGNELLVRKSEFEELNIKNSSNKISELCFIKENTYPGLSIDRETNESHKFYFKNDIQIQYQRLYNYIIRPYMYFLVEGKQTKELLSSIRLMSEEGIGGRRSRGLGFFQEVEVLKKVEIININRDYKYYMNLSVVFPDKNDIDKLLSYKLEKKNGYIYSLGGQPYRKKSVRIIKEGSIFNNKINGKIIDISPDIFNEHKVYLNGKAFLFGFGGVK